MVTSQNTVPITVHRHMSTTNQSFINMHYWLKSQGLQKNDFFLTLYDTDLLGINPRDPNLNVYYKQKILRECMINLWYFLREVVLIPESGGAVGGGARYRLDRGNLALNFGFVNNWNMFVEFPRQFGKTISAICYYLWVFNFGTTQTEMMFLNKKHDDSKLNLQRLKTIREALPEYLRFEAGFGLDGKPLKPTNRAESLSHISNGNSIKALPGARNKVGANGLGRGCTMPIHWYDEYAFILFNTIIYASATPAYKTASENAKKNNKPYGILITTTPGDLTTEEGMDAYETRNSATPFYERYYDYSYDDMVSLKNCNTNSSFFHIRYTYQQLGKGEEYFKEMVIDLKRKWSDIRREVLLEWANMASNSPFTQQDLEILKGLVAKESLYKIYFGKGTSYVMDVWTQSDLNRYPPIIGVDVSGGYQRDSSAITVIDSHTTNVMATFNCNYISPRDLAKVVYELVTRYMPNAIVNVERNGGFGDAVLKELIKTKVKRNLYFEIKDKVIEERFDGYNSIKKNKRVKTFGTDQTKNTRELLMEILRNRMDNHKSKFKAYILYHELCTLEVKKNGRIEHASNAHDDQIFSYLMALYVWYEGRNLMENFGLQVRQISTDDNEDEVMTLEEDYEDVLTDNVIEDSNEEVQAQLEYLKSTKSFSMNEWDLKMHKENQEALDRLLKTKIGRDAYLNTYHEDPEELEARSSILFTIPGSVYGDPTVEPEDSTRARLQKEFDRITDLR